jgi:hypothetical protein
MSAPFQLLVEIVQEDVRQQRREDALNAKDNFQFERMIDGWRQRHLLLDLRRKQ